MLPPLSQPKVTETATISMAELDRLRHTAFDVDKRYQQAIEKRTMKATLHEKSKARVANWSNTLEGSIAARNREKLIRLE